MSSLMSLLLFRPPPKRKIERKEFIWLTTANNANQICAVHYCRVNTKYTLLYSHANGEDIGMISNWLKSLSRSLNVNIFVYDYSGYGYSEGSPSEKQCYIDIETAFDYLTEEERIPSENIILYGKSIGSGPTCYLGAKLASKGIPIGGIILESAFSSIFRLMSNFNRTFIGDMFPNIDYLPNTNCPVIIIHELKDDYVPRKHGQELSLAVPEAYRTKPYFVPCCSHKNLPHTTFVQIIKQFIHGIAAKKKRIVIRNETNVQRKIKK